MLSCHRAFLCPSYSAGKINCMVLLFLPHGLGCESCLWPWNAVPAGGESWEPGQQEVRSCVALQQGSDFDISTHECDSFLGRGFLVSPTGCLPFPPLLVPLKSVQFCSSFYGEMCRAWSILRKKAEGKIWDSSAWQSCSSATQKWKQPLSPVGMTSLLPTLFWDSPGQGDWARTELNWWCSHFVCDFRRGGEVVINCSFVD